MKRIVLRHLSGSKANQVEEFPLNHFEELVIGRDPSSTVKFDPDKDDLVGRQHAKIRREGADSNQFVLTDLGSRNGTYINKERILGSVNIAPGDVVQFGPGGPEFQFDLDPRPEGLARATRVVGADEAATAIKPNGPPPTRVGSAPLGSMGGASAAGAAPKQGVGKTTVHRMLTQSKGESRKYMIVGAAALLLVIAAVTAASVYLSRRDSQQRAAELASSAERAAAEQRQQLSALDARAGKVEERTSAMSPTEIAAQYTNSTVMVQLSWSLIETKGGRHLTCKYIPNRYRGADGREHSLIDDGREYVAAYMFVGSGEGGAIEPVLTPDSSAPGYPVGRMGSGSGFVITSDGFILTNKHVASNWQVPYTFPKVAFPGVMVKRDGSLLLDQEGRPQPVNPALVNWIPAETKQFGGSILGAPAVEGRNDTLSVTFPKTQLRIPAKVVRVSDRHDVAMLKIDIPEPLKKVELNDNYDTIQPGDPAVVLGYPGGSPPELTVVSSKAARGHFAQQQVGIIPNATLSVGNISKVAREQEGTGGKDAVISSGGDYYQLTINSTGMGNSGGPVFDEKGRVIAVFTYALANSDFAATGAVPIRYAKELMGVTATMK